MNDKSVEGLLLCDDQGRCYFISREQLEQNRVPADRAGLLDQQPADAEVSGYVLVGSYVPAPVSSYSMSSGGDRPTESLSLNFTKIEWVYFPQK